MQIHPELAAMLEAFKDAPPMDFVNMPVPEIRELMAQMPFPPADLPMHEVRELSMTGGAGQPMKARLYRPDDVPVAPVMVFFHGGGWCIGTLDSHDSLCRHLARLLSMNVVSVDYRLAPEHVFPAAQDDAYAATRWVADHAAQLHCDASQLVVAGDSAGVISPLSAACVPRKTAGRAFKSSCCSTLCAMRAWIRSHTPCLARFPC